MPWQWSIAMVSVCHLCYCSEKWSYEAIGRTQHLNTKHSDLVHEPTEFFMNKGDAIKIENYFQSFMHWHFTFDGILFNIITDS
jgi:hypothetical protein